MSSTGFEPTSLRVQSGIVTTALWVQMGEGGYYIGTILRRKSFEEVFAPCDIHDAELEGSMFLAISASADPPRTFNLRSRSFSGNRIFHLGRFQLSPELFHNRLPGLRVVHRQLSLAHDCLPFTPLSITLG
jgi:hypothetical protein